MVWATFWLFASALVGAIGALTVPDTFHRVLREGPLVLAAIAFLMFVASAADALNRWIKRRGKMHPLLQKPRAIKTGMVSGTALLMLFSAPYVHRQRLDDAIVPRVLDVIARLMQRHGATDIDQRATE